MSKFDRSPKDASSGSPARVLELELEPLSEQRWAKIEQSVFARLDAGDFPSTRYSEPTARGSARGVGGWALGVAAVAAVAVAIVALRLPLRSPSPSVSRISTGVVASHVALPGVVLDVSPESAVVVSGNSDESAFIMLDRGEVACEAAHRRPGSPLIVQAGEVSVEVVGTRFRVARRGDAATVSVQEGVVRVKFRDQTAMVRAGQSWPFQPPAAAIGAPALDQSTPFQRPTAPALAAPIASSEAADSPIADPSASMDESAAIPRAREVSPRSVRKVPTKRSEARENSEASGAEPSPEAAPPSRQAQFELATQLEAKDPVAAIRLYQGLENSPSNWAANALFAHGRLEAARGNRAVARGILTQYLSRFPSGTNVPDARLLLARLE